MKWRVLYNPYAAGGKGEAAVRGEQCFRQADAEFYDMTHITSYARFFAGMDAEDSVVICGGDGTLNRFLNDTQGLDSVNALYYYASGTGNDFLRDVGAPEGSVMIDLKPYLRDLPTVCVNGKTYRFLNNVGFGIDGYCTEVGDRMRAAHKENINYTQIAIKGLLGGFHPVNATVTVDGVTRSYKKVWLAPTMKGRYYGGGMMPAPEQDRSDAAHSVSVMVYHGAGKLRALMVFPSIFKGEHVQRKDMVDVLSGQDICVKFDRPTPLQIDGETILDVTEYHVRTAAAEAAADRMRIG